ncbi:hypothetical protein HK102_007921, partial [Quaeritorhiza haematococci]
MASMTASVAGTTGAPALVPVGPLANVSSDSMDVVDIEPEKQLKDAIDSIQDAYDRRVRYLTSEVLQWKQIASSQRDQIDTLEADVSHLQQRVSELEKLVAAQHAEKKAILASKAALLDRYTLLKKSANQLESFRKSIVSMVEYGPATHVNVGEFDQTFAESLALDDDHLLNLENISLSGVAPNGNNSLVGADLTMDSFRIVDNPTSDRPSTATRTNNTNIGGPPTPIFGAGVGPDMAHGNNGSSLQNTVLGKVAQQRGVAASPSMRAMQNGGGS